MDILIARITFTNGNREEVDVRITQDYATGKLFCDCEELQEEFESIPAMGTIAAINYVRDEVAYWNDCNVTWLADVQDYE